MTRTTTELDGGRSGGAAEALPAEDEQLFPWLGAAAIAAVVILGMLTLGEGHVTRVEIATLLGGLGATLAVAGLVAARSARAVDASDQEERARPAREELTGQAATAHVDGFGARSYLAGMEGWTVALLELVAHANETAEEPLRDELLAAGDDTDALRGLLHASSQRDLSLGEVATLHSVCALWETSQERIEGLAAAVDPAWHRRWRARSVVERSLRHGPVPVADVDLPYRS